MIVGCERCSTQFQLDDSRVPPDGVKVRCSRCKHAFEVFPEGAAPAPGGDEEAIHAIAERTAETDGIPDASEDPPEAPVAAASPDPTLDDEPSWEFGDGFSDLSADAGDSADGLGESGALRDIGPAEGGSSGLQLAGESPADPAPAAEADGALASGLFDSDQLEEPAPPLATGPAPRSDTGARRDAGDDLGSPMDWDLLDDGPAPAAETGTFSIEPEARTPAAGLPAAAESAADDGEPDARQIWLRRAATAAGWLATAGLCLAGLVHGLRPAPVETPAPAPPGEGWALEEVEGRWIDHLSRGPVFAVSGQVRNTAPATRALPTLEVVWRDRSGAAVGRPTPLTLPRSEQALREAPLGEAPRWPLAGRALRSGAGARFLALAPELPYAADHFELRLRASAPSGAERAPGAD